METTYFAPTFCLNLPIDKFHSCYYELNKEASFFLSKKAFSLNYFGKERLSSLNKINNLELTVLKLNALSLP